MVQTSDVLFAKTVTTSISSLTIPIITVIHAMTLIANSAVDQALRHVRSAWMDTPLTPPLSNVLSVLVLIVVLALQLPSQHALIAQLAIACKTPHVLHVLMVPIPPLALHPAQVVLILVVQPALEVDYSNVPHVLLTTIAIPVPVIVLLVQMDTSQLKEQVEQLLLLVPLVAILVAKLVLLLAQVSALLVCLDTCCPQPTLVVLALILTVILALALMPTNAQFARILTPLPMVFARRPLPIPPSVKLEESPPLLSSMVTLLVITLHLVELVTSLIKSPMLLAFNPIKLKLSVLSKVQSSLSSRLTLSPLLL